MATDFLINTASHKRWYLPNRDYALNSVIYGNEIRLSVIHTDTLKTYETVILKLDADDKWKDLAEQFHLLARRKYTDPLRTKQQAARDELFRRQHPRIHR